MIHIDQVRTLELKVKQAVQLIVHLRRENDHLRGRLADTEVHLQELEDMLQSLKASQNEIETGIRSALLELDHIEDSGAALPEVASVPDDAAPSAVMEQASEKEEPEESEEPVLADTSQETFEEIFESAPEGEMAPVPEPAPQAEEEEDQPGLGIF